MPNKSLKIRPIFIIIPLLIIDLSCLFALTSSIQERKVLIKNDSVTCSDFIIKQVRTESINIRGRSHFYNSIVASDINNSNINKFQSQSLIYKEFESDFDIGKFLDPVNICYFAIENRDFNWIQNVSYKNNIIFTETSLFITDGDIAEVVFFVIFLTGAHIILLRKPKKAKKESF